MTNEKINRFMDTSGFFGGNFEDLTLDLVNEYFTEENFRNCLGCDDDDFAKIASDFGFEDGIIDWEWIQGEARWELSCEIAQYVRENEDCTLTYGIDELMEWVDLIEDETGEMSDDERRQYWNVDGRFAKNRDDWEKILLWLGYEKGDSSWKQAESRLADFHRDVDNELFPVCCHVHYVLGDDWEYDEQDTIEGSGIYDMTGY